MREPCSVCGRKITRREENSAVTWLGPLKVETVSDTTDRISHQPFVAHAACYEQVKDNAEWRVSDSERQFLKGE